MKIFSSLPGNNQARLSALVDLIEQFLPIQKWDFTQSVSFFSSNRPDISFGSREPVFPTVIYNSARCRVKFLLTNEDHNDFLIVYYGRLHAPNDERIINWNGKDCYCWCWNTHNLLFKYLDGCSPQEAVNRRGKPPERLHEFVESHQMMPNEQPKYAIKFHAAAWDNYGDNLFDLFDLSHPELWEKYVLFVRAYYDIVGIPRNIVLPLYEIC